MSSFLDSAHTSRTCLTGICVLLLVWLQETGAAPLDVLRSMWVVEDSSWTSNPAHLARWQGTQTEFEVGHDAVAHSLTGESTTRTIAGSQRIRLSRGTLKIDGQTPGTDLNLTMRGSLVSSRPHHGERLAVSYGATLGRYLDLGVMAHVAASSDLKGGAVGLQLHAWERWLADAYYYLSSEDRSTLVDLDDEDLVLETRGLYFEGGFTMRGNLTHRLRITIRGSQSGIKPGDQSDNYTLDTEGTLRSLQGSWQAQITRSIVVIGDGRYRVLAWDPDGRLEDRQFFRSQLDFSDLGGALWVRRMGLRGDYLDMGFFLSHGDASVRRGRLESWAFINSFATLLGGKDWSGSGQADLRLVGAGVRLQKSGRAWAFGTDTRLLRASSHVSGVVRERTKLDFTSLLFPKTYRQEGEIELDAFDIKASIGYQSSRWGARYEFAQIIPLRVKAFVEGDGPGGEGSGGTQHRLVFVLQ